MNLIEDDHVVENLSATASNPAFRDSILPGTSETDPLGFDAPGDQQISRLLAELRISIQNRIAVGTRIRKCFPQLLHYPGTGRVFGDIEMEDFAPAVFDDEEAIQHSEGNGWYGEEVHGYDGIAMITKESRPELAGLVGRRQATEETGDGTFGDVEAEFEELTVNSWCAPGWVL